jgi:flagellar protein FliS
LNRVRQYQNIQVLTADRVSLIIMLYDGILRFNRLASQSIKDGDIKGRGVYINRSLEIIGELANSLNMEEGGEIAKNLSKLYDFCASTLTEANLKSDIKAIESVNKVVLEIKSGWEAVAAERQKRAAEEPARSVSCGA